MRFGLSCESFSLQTGTKYLVLLLSEIKMCVSRISRFHTLSQIFMKRRAKLYIVNFLLPILFLLCLDLVSFLIPNKAGEKLSFKVTVLLAVTVMQLILNDILPSSSDKTPLIGKIR